MISVVKALLGVTLNDVVAALATAMAAVPGVTVSSWMDGFIAEAGTNDFLAGVAPVKLAMWVQGGTIRVAATAGGDMTPPAVSGPPVLSGAYLERTGVTPGSLAVGSLVHVSVADDLTCMLLMVTASTGSGYEMFTEYELKNYMRNENGCVKIELDQVSLIHMAGTSGLVSAPPRVLRGGVPSLGAGVSVPNTTFVIDAVVVDVPAPIQRGPALGPALLDSRHTAVGAIPAPHLTLGGAWLRVSPRSVGQSYNLMRWDPNVDPLVPT